MIRIPILNNTIESKQQHNKELLKMAKQVEEMSKHPKWIKFIESYNENNPKMGGGVSKKHNVE